MEGLAILLILLAIACLLSGPIALIMVMNLSQKTNAIYRRLGFRETPTGEIPFADTRKVEKPPTTPEIQIKPTLQVAEKPPEQIKTEPASKSADIHELKVDTPPKIPVPTVEIKIPAKKKDLPLEQQIGTRWILVAGVIAIFAGLAFFLKYAYDNFTIGPLGRVIIVTICGLVALAAGEITRRRGYDIVAKGVTALGFAILYVAVFSAYRFYELIDSVPAFVMAILITAAAMIYAVRLNEILIAVLSLIGGFLTPVLVSTGENLPVPLFIYVLILGVGAMACACYRKWRSVNFIAFCGTFFLYIGWFEKFYRPAMNQIENLPQQTAIALGWLGLFFVIYLILPLFYGLVKKIKAQKEDVLLVLFNAAVTFYYLWSVLFTSHRTQLALCALGLAGAHLVMTAVIFKRCKDDVDLRIALLAIGLFFITIAIPLYLKMHAVTMAWAAEAVILIIIGLRYRSTLIQIASAAPLLLSCAHLLINLPMHSADFRLIFNPEFGTWCFVAAAACLCHLLYRRSSQLTEELRTTIAQTLYTLMASLLFAAATMEWYCHCRYNLMTGTGIHYISRGQLIIFSAITLLFIIRPICPRGILCKILSFVLIAAGSIFTVIALIHLHDNSFTIFANLDFAIVLAFITAMLICHIKYRCTTEPNDPQGLTSQFIFALLGLLLLSAIAAEWYWHCKYNLWVTGLAPTVMKGQVMIFAAVMLLFLIRPICPKGVIPKVLAFILAAIGSMFTMITFTEFHNAGFLIFANTDFAIAFLFVVALFAASWLLYRTNHEQTQYNRNFAAAFALTAIFVLWMLLAEEIYQYWYCRNRFVQPLANWKFLAHMYISVMWAVYGAALMLIGFWRNIRMLRYIAIGLFALLLIKVFVYDTRTIENVYRITAFLATGVTLVGVSYLYQFLKKKGFFDSLLIDKTEPGA